ncbi:hypothetical protein [Vibrio sp. WXL103]|uniref:hypothetical protein n=1 Tax=Vibrio sp. WXL103 TaxID=3450710 RepID=UPI003EC5F24B
MFNKSKHGLAYLFTAALVSGCISSDVIVETSSVSGNKVVKGEVNITELWRNLEAKSKDESNEGEIRLYDPLVLEFGQPAFYTFESSLPYVMIDKVLRQVYVIELPEQKGNYSVDLYSYANENFVFEPIYQLFDDSFMPIGQEIKASWVERGNDLTNYFFTSVYLDDNYSNAKYILVYNDPSKLGDEHYAWDARYHYYKDNNTDYPRDVMLTVANSELGVLSAHAY